MPDEIGCQVAPASVSMLCGAFLSRLACCISFGTNRAYGTLLAQYVTILLYLSKVQYITVDVFYCILRFCFFLKLIFLKLPFVEIDFAKKRLLLRVFRLLAFRNCPFVEIDLVKNCLLLKAISFK